MALSPAQVYALARGAGFTAAQATIMTAIAGAESGWNPNARGDVSLANSTWGPSIGLWQIRSLNADNGTGRARDGSRLTDPTFNAAAAMTVFKQQGYSAWSVYSNGRYRNYIGQATSASTSAVAGAAIGAVAGVGATRISWPGHPDKYDAADIASLTAAEKASGQTWTYLQGGYSTRIGKSGTTHAGGGVVDIRPSDRNWTRASLALIANGWIPFPRIDAANWKGNEHIHAVRVGSSTRSSTAAGQESSARAGRNGMAGNASGPYAFPGAQFTSWGGGADVTNAASLNPLDWPGDALASLWENVRPTLFKLGAAGAAAGIVLAGLTLAALSRKD